MQDESDDPFSFALPPSYGEAAEAIMWYPASTAQHAITTASHLPALVRCHSRFTKSVNTPAGRLPSYKHALRARYRAHPYRRPCNAPQAFDSDDASDLETEYVSIMDIITSPQYLRSLGITFPTPLVFPTPPLPSGLVGNERAAVLAARIADIDAAMADVNVWQLTQLESRVVDFILFVRRRYTEQRELALAPRAHGLI
ncbi:hypothetical protein BD626DRAFT_52182 [Schizophyllum amplum]|uniref:Uncharacterized protein n=1 Tax=Schizophyllum amplum TaxID=97359 RepID=A0A550CCW1_9AGAR|nr:hypothetical protein BD626DRAFT_52182 [Auriculariopsis ampla]